jgi:hypothetical protein
MIKKRRFYFGLLILISLSLLNGCSDDSQKNKAVATLTHPALSPSGKFVLQVAEGSDQGVQAQCFQILQKDQNGNLQVIFSSPDHYRTRDALYFFWDDADRVWVYSGDIGAYYWTYTTSSNWEKSTYVDGKEKAPNFLKSIRPQFFH